MMSDGYGVILNSNGWFELYYWHDVNQVYNRTFIYSSPSMDEIYRALLMRKQQTQDPVYWIN